MKNRSTQGALTGRTFACRNALVLFNRRRVTVYKGREYMGFSSSTCAYRRRSLFGMNNRSWNMEVFRAKTVVYEEHTLPQAL